MSAQPSPLFERLRDEVKWACPSGGFETRDAETLLATEDYTFGHALAMYHYEVEAALVSQEFCRKVARLYIEAGSTRAGSPERAAAQSLLTHTLRNQFEAIARDVLAPIIRTDLNSIVDDVWQRHLQSCEPTDAKHL